MRWFLFLFLFILCLSACDLRDPDPFIDVSTLADHAYVADSTEIAVNVLYSNDNVYNQRIYLKTDNGMIRNKLGQYVESGNQVWYNTDEYGKCIFYYTKPDTTGISTITAKTFVDAEFIEDKITLQILQRK